MDRAERARTVRVLVEYKGKSYVAGELCIEKYSGAPLPRDGGTTLASVEQIQEELDVFNGRDALFDSVRLCPPEIVPREWFTLATREIVKLLKGTKTRDERLEDKVMQAYFRHYGIPFQWK